MSEQREAAERHVVVTGAGTGIGRAIALRLASGGVRASLMARDVARLEATAAAARERGAQAAAFGCDVREPAQVESAFAAAAARFGPIDVLVANAGIGGANADGPGDRFDDLVATNLAGTYRCVRAALRRLRPGPRTRHVVVISSILARIGVAGYTGYCASKAGLLGLVRSLAVELAPDDVQVNALCPGWVDTEMARSGNEGLAKSLAVPYERAFELAMDPVPLKRMSRPEEIAGVVAWLVSDDARGVTGQGIDVNNGAFLH
jgi:NAD(P)-dependent dehydrogenase (short-subunit alcohol dehydrogenase family)